MIFVAFMAGFLIGAGVVLAAAVLAFLTPDDIGRYIKEKK